MAQEIIVEFRRAPSPTPSQQRRRFDYDHLVQFHVPIELESKESEKVSQFFSH